MIARRRERLLDGSRTHPPNQVDLRSRLVVRAGPASAAERLLADHRACWLVIDVKVAGGVAQRAHRIAYRRAIAGEDGTGQGIRRSAIDDFQRLRPGGVGIDVRRYDGTEDLLA